jgi:NTP pyrophosphatase (non-canonical NTP hydrolase)
MNIEEICEGIYKFQKKRVSELGAELTPELVFIHFSEEVGEIARQLVNRNLAIRKYEEENLKEEIAQAILDLLVLSRIFNVDLPKTITTKMDKMAKSKKWFKD